MKGVQKMVKVEDIKAVTHDTKFKYAWKRVIALTLLVVTCGCWVNELGQDLDNMAKGRKKFGTISFSEPILVESKKDQSGPFDFTLTTTGPDDYYKDARNDVQGKMASSYQFVKDSGVDLRMQGDISALAAYNVKLKQYEQKLAALEAQKKLRAEARDFEAQKVIAALPDDATEEQRLEAQARAADIRAGQDPIAISEFPTSQVQPPDNAAPPSNSAGNKNATEFLKLLEGTPDLKISNRSAINTAAGDTVTEAIFTLLGSPAKTVQFKDKLMLFGVSMVSITPGYVTGEGYTGELSVACSYDYDIARRDLLKKTLKVENSKKDNDSELIKLIKKVLVPDANSTCDPNSVPRRYTTEFRKQFTPLAAAVSPMTDVDALDLSSSIRNQTFSAMKISAALSYAGFTGQAKVFDNWAEKVEQDTQTRTSYAAVTSFSDSGYFGFRIRPRLKAIIEGEKPGYVLEDQAFPVAVIVGIDTDDLKLAFECDGGKLVAYEPTIEFHQTVNWLPNKEVSLLGKLMGNELTETKRLEWLRSYNEAIKETKAMKEKLKISDPKANYPTEYFEKYVNNRIKLLGNQTLDMFSGQYLPMELLVGKPVKGVPTVDDPNKVFDRWYDAPSTYVIKGKNFEGQVLGANIEGQPCDVKIVGDKITIITSSGWTPKLDANIILAETKIAQADLDIAKEKKKIKDANTILSNNSTDPDVIEKKKKARADLATAESNLAIAKANKEKAEAAKRSAMVDTPESKEFQIDLITKKGSIKAGLVQFARQATPAKPKTSSSGTSKTDNTLTITRTTSGKILTISSKGESKELDKLISIVKEGEKAGANVDLKFNTSGQMDVKADTNTK
jgi:hypothetical protein